MAKKAMVIGLDAAITKSIWTYAQQGKLPNIKKLIDNGTWAENCLAPHPTITPPNWTAITTGSWTGTHGITCYGFYKNGEPLDVVHPMPLSSDVQAERIWQTSEDLDKKTILLNYPTTWPPVVENGVQVGGGGLDINFWQVSPDGRHLPPGGRFYSLCGDQIVSTEEYPLSEPVKVKKAEGFKGSPEGALEVEVDLKFRRALERIKQKTYYLLIVGNKVHLCKSRDIKDSLCRLRVGEWSGVIVDEFETESGRKKGKFKCKLLELSKKRVKFYISPICQSDGWAHPREICEEVAKLNLDSLPLPIYACWEARSLGWIDYQTLLELFDMQHQWLAAVAAHLLQGRDWTLFFIHAHCPDYLYHNFINELQKGKSEYLRYEEKFYQSLDEMIGGITKQADEDTLIIITSDHGQVPTEPGFDFPLEKILSDAGLLSFEEVEETGQRRIDWSKTKAFPQRSVYVYANLKGRDPHGIVEPGEEYEQVRERVINALYDYTDPKTGKKPVVFALKKEDARMLGLYGSRIGDVVFGLRAEAPGDHGRQIPTAEYGVGSMKGLLIMKGPNVKKNYILKRTVWLVDIVPTICYLLDLPVPKDCEGAIIYQALEDPNLKLKELDNTRRDYNRLKRAYEAESHLTHRY